MEISIKVSQFSLNLKVSVRMVVPAANLARRGDKSNKDWPGT
jgi:hypothetical protein